MRGEYWDANRALLRPRNVYPIILLHPHVTPKPGMVTYVTEEVEAKKESQRTKRKSSAEDDEEEERFRS